MYENWIYCRPIYMRIVRAPIFSFLRIFQYARCPPVITLSDRESFSPKIIYFHCIVNITATTWVDGMDDVHRQTIYNSIRPNETRIYALAGAAHRIRKYHILFVRIQIFYIQCSMYIIMLNVCMLCLCVYTSHTYLYKNKCCTCATSNADGPVIFGTHHIKNV